MNNMLMNDETLANNQKHIKTFLNVWLNSLKLKYDFSIQGNHIVQDLFFNKKTKHVLEKDFLLTFESVLGFDNQQFETFLMDYSETLFNIYGNKGRELTKNFTKSFSEILFELPSDYILTFDALKIESHYFLFEDFSSFSFEINKKLDDLSYEKRADFEEVKIKELLNSNSFKELSEEEKENLLENFTDNLDYYCPYSNMRCLVLHHNGTSNDFGFEENKKPIF